MSPRILVYTCVFRGYDRVFPPVHHDPTIDYVLITDDPSTSVPGWRTIHVDRTQFGSESAPNRYFKMLAHKSIFPGYDVSIYVDGNIRVIGRTTEFAANFLESGAALGVFRHPRRQSIEEEAKACLESGKLADVARLESELADYTADGFPDKQGLMETGVVVKNHRHRALDEAMELWWRLFERFDSRDQISLPYAIWKTGLPTLVIEQSFREPNPYFGLYPHSRSGSASRQYAYVAARAFDSRLHAMLKQLWEGKWRVQRRLRRLLRGGL